jgi:hypothetical protein
MNMDLLNQLICPLTPIGHRGELKLNRYKKTDEPCKFLLSWSCQSQNQNKDQVLRIKLKPNDHYLIIS